MGRSLRSAPAQEQGGWGNFKWSRWEMCSDTVLLSGLLPGSCASHFTCLPHLCCFYGGDSFVSVEVFQDGSIKTLAKGFLKASQRAAGCCL